MRRKTKTGVIVLVLLGVPALAILCLDVSAQPREKVDDREPEPFAKLLRAFKESFVPEEISFLSALPGDSYVDPEFGQWLLGASAESADSTYEVAYTYLITSIGELPPGVRTGFGIQTGYAQEEVEKRARLAGWARLRAHGAPPRAKLLSLVAVRTPDGGAGSVRLYTVRKEFTYRDGRWQLDSSDVRAE